MTLHLGVRYLELLRVRREKQLYCSSKYGSYVVLFVVVDLSARGNDRYAQCGMRKEMLGESRNGRELPLENAGRREV